MAIFPVTQELKLLICLDERLKETGVGLTNEDGIEDQTSWEGVGVLTGVSHVGFQKCQCFMFLLLSFQMLQVD